VLEILAEHPTPVAALLSVVQLDRERVGVGVALASLGRRETVLEIYRAFPNGEGYQRIKQTKRPPRPPKDTVLEAALDVGLRRSR
jgi:hypothetical protein